MPGQSPNQTVGPFFHNCLIKGREHLMADEATQGQLILLQGQVLDGDGLPVPDALVEIWQADSQGHFDHAEDSNQATADRGFRGFGRSQTVDNGQFIFQTIKPGIIPGQATPFINVRVFARGMLIHAVTRIYFADEAGNARDTVLNSVPAERRPTLIAAKQPSVGLPTYTFNVRLQGEGETVFFDA